MRNCPIKSYASWIVLPFVLFSLNKACSYAQSNAMPPVNSGNQSYGMPEDQSAPETYYTDYSEQAMEAYRKGESTKAVELMTKAFQLAPNNHAVLNNLAACYIQRGVYFQNNKKDYSKALSDYRLALFFLVHEWPSDVQRTATSDANIKILENNIEGVMKNLNVPLNDWKWHLQTAWELRRKGNLQEAMVEYAKVTTLNPKHSESWIAEGDIYTVRQRHDKAVVSYQKGVETSSAPSDALYVKLGTSLLHTGLSEKAVEAFTKAIAINSKNKDALLSLEQVWKKEIVLNPRNMSAHLNLGAVYQQMGRFDDAFAQYQVAERLSPGNPTIKLNLGSLHQAKGQLDQAAAIYDAILQQNPNNAQALLYRADIFKRQGKVRESEQMLQRALHLNADKKQILDQLVMVYKTEGDPEKIKSGWQMYADTFPGDVSVQYQAGLSLHEIKDYEGAIRYYQKAVQIKPDMAEAYANMGTAYHALNRNDDALKALKQAFKLNPQMEEVKTMIATLEQNKGTESLVQASKLHEEGHYKEALKHYEDALKQDSQNADIYARYGLSLQAVKRYADASAAYDKAISIEPSNAFYYYYKGTLYDEQNQLDTAKKLYEKAISLDANLSQAKDALESLKTGGVENLLSQALDAYNKKSYPKALQKIEEALRIEPGNATAYYYKGLVYEAEKKFEPARIAYVKAVELNTGFSDALYALAVVLDTQGKKPEAKKTYQQFIDITKDQPEDDFIRYAKERVSSL